MYADDITIYVSGKSVNEVQTKLASDLSQIIKWCEVNKMFINVNKSKSMLICSSQKRTSLPVTNLKLVVNEIPVECVESVKILGLTIDQTLSWHTHVGKVCLKMYRLIGLPWRIKNHLDFSTRILYYNSYILPAFDYCLNVWCVMTWSDSDRILKLQKRAIRIVTNSDREAPSKPLFQRLGWMTVTQRADYQTAVLDDSHTES